MVVLFWIFFTFWITSIVSCIVAPPVYILMKSAQSIPSPPYLCQHLSLYIYFFSFWWHHSNRCKVTFHCGFDLHILIIINGVDFSMYLLAICMSSWKDVYSVHFLTRFFFSFLPVSPVSSLNILDINPLYLWLQIFSSFFRLPFHFVEGFLCYDEAF